MKHILFFALVFATTTFAQPIVSPEVHSDDRVTLRLSAPGAKEAQVRCESVKECVMRKGDQGVWSFTSPPLETDIGIGSPWTACA